MTRQTTAKRFGPASSSIWMGVVALLLGLLLVGRLMRPPGATTTPDRLPPLDVAGWLNAAEPPTVENLRGKVVLVDCWATWCGPCVHFMPEVVALKDRFAGQDLRIVGLTPESGGDVENVAQFVENMPGLDWPIGYGAEPALAALACEGFPTFYVFDRRGRLVSVGHNHRTAEEAIVQALAR